MGCGRGSGAARDPKGRQHIANPKTRLCTGKPVAEIVLAGHWGLWDLHLGAVFGCTAAYWPMALRAALTIPARHSWHEVQRRLQYNPVAQRLVHHA